jgi:hypothetical protein
MKLKFSVLLIIIILIANSKTTLAFRPRMLSHSYGYSSQVPQSIPPPLPPPPPIPEPVPIPSPIPIPVVQPVIQQVRIPFCVPTLKLNKHYRYEYEDYNNENGYDQDEDGYYHMKKKVRKPYYRVGLSLCEIEVPRRKPYHKKYHHEYGNKKKYHKNEYKYNKYDKKKRKSYNGEMGYQKNSYGNDNNSGEYADYNRHDNYYRK